MIGNIIGSIQNYFKDWLTRTGGVGAYTTFLIDLSEAHSEQGYNFSGDQIIIVKSESRAYIKLNDKRNENIDTTRVNQINTPFKMFYISNDVGTGSLEILVGTEGVFNSIPARINAVITDPEDTYGHIHQIGNAELAARLGALQSWDRRGNIVWFDDFEHSLNKWDTHVTGAGASAAISTDTALTKGNSCKLVGGDNMDHTDILRWLQTMPKGRIGIEFSFSVDEHSSRIDLDLTYFDGANANKAGLLININEDKLTIQTGALTYEDIATGLAWQHDKTCFHTVKIVMDLDKDKYVRLIHRDVEYDISMFPIHSWVAGGSGCAYLNIAHKPLDTHNAVCYIDNVIITQNEP